MEKLLDTSRSIHDRMIKTLTKPLKREKIEIMIDAGSGKTSASILLKYFPNAELDAVIFPGDNRKKNPLSSALGTRRLEIIEADICQTEITKSYDLCLIHLSLGEALHFGNHFEDMFHHIMDIKSKYFVLIDVLEDPCVHFRYIEQFLKEKGFKVIIKKKFKNPTPEHYPKVKYDKYKLEYDSKHYIGYLIKRESN